MSSARAVMLSFEGLRTQSRGIAISMHAAALLSAQLAAFPARRPSLAVSCGFSARKPSFMASFSSWPLLGPLVTSQLVASQHEAFPHVWPLPRPHYSLFQHIFSQAVISTPCAASNNERFNRSSKEKKRSSIDQITTNCKT